MAPIWTSARDRELTELHGRKLDLKFITNWLRMPRADIVSRLAELGLALKKGPPRGPRPSARAAPQLVDVPILPVRLRVADRREPTFAHVAQLRDAYPNDMAPGRLLAVERLDNDDDEHHGPTGRGCAPGHLMPEAEITALYHALSRNYG